MMLVFAPVSRVGPYETLSYDDLFDRLAPTDRVHLLQAAMCAGDLQSYVQPPGEGVFYKVPHSHWTEGGFFEGEPGSTLFCWAMGSKVPHRFHNLPLLFFADEVEAWHDKLQERIWDRLKAETGVGRPKGAGGYAASDAKLYPDMLKLRTSGEAASDNEAARRVEHRAKGSTLNRARRLRDGFKKWRARNAA